MLIDSHEPRFFRERFPYAKVVDLPIGDFILGDEYKTYIVERKEILDLVNSIKSKRLWEQLKDLVLCRDDNTIPLFILEGGYWKVKRFTKFSVKALESAELSICVRWGVPVIRTRNMQHTAKVLEWIDRHESRSVGSPRVPNKSIKDMSLKEKKIWLLTSLPEMGVKKAEEVLRKFSTIKGFIDNIDKAIWIQGISERMVETWRQILYE